eukprot:241823-Rhodomonas_salina.1
MRGSEHEERDCEEANTRKESERGDRGARPVHLLLRRNNSRSASSGSARAEGETRVDHSAHGARPSQ